MIFSPNRWSCMVCSFAMACDVSLETFLRTLGHDGSEKMWPGLQEPRQRKGFMLEECVSTAFKLGRTTTVLPFEAKATPDGVFYRDFQNQSYVMDVMRRHDGVLMGRGRAGIFHAVAYKSQRVLDPSHGEYALPSHNFEPHTFCVVI